MVVLRDDDLVLGCEAAGGGAGWLHECLSVATGGVGFGAGIASDEPGSFGGADGFAGAAFGQELEDRRFQGWIVLGGVVAAAGVGAEF